MSYDNMMTLENVIFFEKYIFIIDSKKKGRRKAIFKL